MALTKEDAVFLLKALDVVQIQNIESIKNAHQIIIKLEKLAEVPDVNSETTT